MANSTRLMCVCEETHLEVEKTPIASVECCCTSCRECSKRLQDLNGARQILTEYEATPYVMYRKDRIRFVKGHDSLREIRITPDAKTRRVVATCCNTPMFLEFAHGHWLSLYAGLWPADSRPPVQMRTMAMDLQPGVVLPNDMPNAKRQSVQFFFKLLNAWIAMGFRIPQVPETPTLEA